MIRLSFVSAIPMRFKTTPDKDKKTNFATYFIYKLVLGSNLPLICQGTETTGSVSIFQA